MSIIYDALKKTQHKLQNVPPVSSNPQGSPSNQGPQDQKLWLWAAVFAISLGFLACGIALVKITMAKNATLSSTMQTKNGSSSLAASVSNAFNPSQASPKKVESSDTLVLNGIMSMGEEELALINNKIYKAGDYVGEKRILSISVDKVEIFDKGKTITLTTK